MSYTPNPRVEVTQTQIFINNEFVDSVSGKTFPVINPSTGEKICEVQEGEADDVDNAVKAAMAAFHVGSEWRTMNASRRGFLINKLGDLVERDLDYFINLNTLENGKPFKESIDELHLTLSAFRYYAGAADKIHGKTIPADGVNFTYTRVEPIGVCGLILPWNFAIAIAANKMCVALATGNTVILKPAEQTPLTVLYLAGLVKEAGFPPGVVNVVPGFGTTAGAALSGHQKVDKVSFKGSPEVGKIILQAAGVSNLKRISMECGGNSPLVVCSDVDIGEAAQIAHDAVFYNKGECCCAGARTFVHEDIYDEFVEKSKELAMKRKVGDPFDPETLLGAQIDEKQFNKTMELIESGKEEGAKLECGGGRSGCEGYFVQPTVFSNVEDNMRIAREEIFGPVMQIMKYSTLEEVIERSNDTEYGLAAAIVTKDLNTATLYAQQVRAGMVWVNCHFVFAGQVPFGGYKISGYGKEFGEDAIMDYTQIKAVVTSIPQKHS